ncbi:hypothetical protein H5410_019815 [Solanum commersonii]|uniref:Uncharacterized protein n=1 Tax=Solanum commersonii TaxID=4109 RepID=A0A9J5ZCC0_SOLCO|nr:hypothetical protein H5410_019815 [Solanum commersonii]
MLHRHSLLSSSPANFAPLRPKKKSTCESLFLFWPNSPTPNELFISILTVENEKKKKNALKANIQHEIKS